MFYTQSSAATWLRSKLAQTRSYIIHGLWISVSDMSFHLNDIRRVKCDRSYIDIA